MATTDPPWELSTSLPARTSLAHTPTHTDRDRHSATSSPSLTIPSSTVIGLGLGFVAAAMCVVGGTVLFRVLQVQRSARRARAAGNPHATFRATWESWGGWWGMFFVQDEQSIWNRRLRVRVKNLARPSIFDIVLPKDGIKDEFGASDQPLASEAAYGHDPRLAFSVLIRMPMERRQSGTPPEEPELPELVLGTAYVPYPGDIGDLSIETQPKEVAQVVSVEVLSPPRRQTGWGTTGWPAGWPPGR